MPPIKGDIVGEDLFAVDRLVGMWQTARATRDLRRTIAAMTPDPTVQSMRPDRQRAVSGQDEPGHEAAVSGG